MIGERTSEESKDNNRCCISKPSEQVMNIWKRYGFRLPKMLLLHLLKSMKPKDPERYC